MTVMDALAHEIARLATTPNFAGAVITGSERAFAAGAEIAELTRLSGSEAFEFSRVGQEVLGTIASSDKPVVAAIRGYCIGGGLDLALACRARIATADTVFAHPGVTLGIITGWGGTQRLPRLIGRGRALEMFVVEGIKTSIPLQRKIMMEPDFIAGKLDTHFLDRFATSRAG